MKTEIPKYLTEPRAKKERRPLTGYDFLKRLQEIGLIHTTDLVHGVTIHAQINGAVEVTVHRYADDSLLPSIEED